MTLLYLHLLSLLLSSILSTEVGSRGPSDTSRAFHTVSNEVNTVLVLGGQGLSGSATVDALLAANYKVTVLNDGKNYFDYNDYILPRVQSIVCLRHGGLDGCFELQQYLQSTKKVSAIIDFTSSNSDYMEQSVRLLSKLKPDVYIFVSAAAVYDVSKDFRKVPIPESVAIRPPDALRETYGEMNTFGDNMFSSEEVLVSSGLPYVILRSADTVGSRDTTHRWWQYQIWSSYYNIIGQPFPIPDHLTSTQFSLTYGPDVGQAVVAVLQNKILNREYNIAIDKSFTLQHLLLELCTHLNVTECTADYSEKKEMYALFPSNHNGPIDTSKAKAELKFSPSPWTKVLSESVKFYKDGLKKFVKERDIVLERLNKNIIPYSRITPLYNAINAHAIATDASNADTDTSNADSSNADASETSNADDSNADASNADSDTSNADASNVDANNVDADIDNADASNADADIGNADAGTAEADDDNIDNAYASTGSKQEL